MVIIVIVAMVHRIITLVDEWWSVDRGFELLITKTG